MNQFHYFTVMLLICGIDGWSLVFRYINFVLISFEKPSRFASKEVLSGWTLNNLRGLYLISKRVRWWKRGYSPSVLDDRCPYRAILVSTTFLILVSLTVSRQPKLFHRCSTTEREQTNQIFRLRSWTFFSWVADFEGCVGVRKAYYSILRNLTWKFAGLRGILLL